MSAGLLVSSSARSVRLCSGRAWAQAQGPVPQLAQLALDFPVPPPISFDFACKLRAALFNKKRLAVGSAGKIFRSAATLHCAASFCAAHFAVKQRHTMFPVPKVPKKAAYRQLQQHLLALGAWVAAVRALPYVLQALQDAQR